VTIELPDAQTLQKTMPVGYARWLKGTGIFEKLGGKKMEAFGLIVALKGAEISLQRGFNTKIESLTEKLEEISMQIDDTKVVPLSLEGAAENIGYRLSSMFDADTTSPLKWEKISLGNDIEIARMDLRILNNEISKSSKVAVLNIVQNYPEALAELKTQGVI